MRYEQIVVLKVTVPADDSDPHGLGQILPPALWDWNTICDMDSPNSIQVIAASAFLGEAEQI